MTRPDIPQALESIDQAVLALWHAQSVLKLARAASAEDRVSLDAHGAQPPQAPPLPGEAWPEQGGFYAGIARAEDGLPAGHLVLLDAQPDGPLDWTDATRWAESLGDGARLPTRFESALLYAQLRDRLDTDGWHWTGTQYSANSAWVQNFYGGNQTTYSKSFEGRARAVRRLTLESFNPSTGGAA